MGIIAIKRFDVMSFTKLDETQRKIKIDGYAYSVMYLKLRQINILLSFCTHNILLWFLEGKVCVCVCKGGGGGRGVVYAEINNHGQSDSKTLIWNIIWK